MVLLYENDPLDSEEARGHFYHVCLGRIDRTELRFHRTISRMSVHDVA